MRTTCLAAGCAAWIEAGELVCAGHRRLVPGGLWHLRERAQEHRAAAGSCGGEIEVSAVESVIVECVAKSLAE